MSKDNQQTTLASSGRPLILGSTSRYRKELLTRLRIPFETASPDVDETPHSNESPKDLALRLALAKARAVALKYPEAVVIGSDQVCTLGGVIFDKPGTPEKAYEQLQIMQEKTHELITAVTLISPLGVKCFVNKTTLHMRALTPEQIKNYVDEDKPLDCAGSYKLESRGMKLFEKIEMNDHTSIIGLPLIELTSELLRMGYPL